MGDIFKCRSCGEKYEHIMCSEDDVSICHWCDDNESEVPGGTS